MERPLSYLDLLAVAAAAGARSEVGLRAPLHQPLLPAEGQPVPGEPRRLHEREQRQRRAPVVGYVDGQPVGRVVEGHRRQGGVRDAQRRLLVRVRRADEHVEARPVLPGDLAGENLRELSAAHGAPPEGLCECPHEGEDQVGDSEGEKEAEGEVVRRAKEGEDAMVEEAQDGKGVDDGVGAVEMDQRRHLHGVEDARFPLLAGENHHSCRWFCRSIR